MFVILFCYIIRKMSISFVSYYSQTITMNIITDDSPVDEYATLSTELQPPPLPENDNETHQILFLINLYAVQNKSDDERDSEVLQDDLAQEIPEIRGIKYSYLLD